jgi:hypothetical protein
MKIVCKAFIFEVIKIIYETFSGTLMFLKFLINLYSYNTDNKIKNN